MPVSVRIRPVRAWWTMRDGTRIRICDMGDGHVLNTLRMLERGHEYKTRLEVDQGFAVLSTLQGEMAVQCIDEAVQDYIRR